MDATTRTLSGGLKLKLLTITEKQGEFIVNSGGERTMNEMDCCDGILELIERQPTITTASKEKNMNEEKWITINFKNGEVCHYKPDEYTDYYYDKRYFIVIRDKQWIGLYNLDEIRYVEVSTVEEAEGKKKYTFYEE